MPSLVENSCKVRAPNGCIGSKLFKFLKDLYYISWIYKNICECLVSETLFTLDPYYDVDNEHKILIIIGLRVICLSLEHKQA